MEIATGIVLTGIGATALTDLWGWARRKWLGVPQPDYAMVGRWLAGVVRGQLHHESMAAAPAVRGERVVGWTAHYLIGIAFAALMPLVFGPEWLRQPALAPALLVGIVTVAAPFLTMQPGMGLGIAASKTQRPWRARMHSIITHTVFGLGLFLVARAMVELRPL